MVYLKYALHLTAPAVTYFKLENHTRNINLLVTSTKLKFVQGVLRNETNFKFRVTRNDDGVTLGLKPSSSQMSGAIKAVVVVVEPVTPHFPPLLALQAP